MGNIGTMDYDESLIDDLEDVEEIAEGFELSKVTINSIITEALHQTAKYKAKDGTYLDIEQAKDGIENHEYDETFELCLNEIMDKVIEQVMIEWNMR
jgi:predicted DNA-binding protein YlxM (UPF0122 family)